jgi:hypothetical protein
VVDSSYFEALQAAGIANARERAGLIEYLASLGFTADEMLEAEHAAAYSDLQVTPSLGQGVRPTRCGPLAKWSSSSATP